MLDALAVDGPGGRTKGVGMPGMTGETRGLVYRAGARNLIDGIDHNGCIVAHLLEHRLQQKCVYDLQCSDLGDLFDQNFSLHNHLPLEFQNL